ncbi:hypothetical protein CK203_068030 [Vitis vinifera]|uniref:Uncharacterized protein n=1 Tax=Vitis vinifera TaxID=29760 RepID=A0A438EWC3_VITVI|nr:hypothetical protein CK203_068030 [Vitis vinifera]
MEFGLEYLVAALFSYMFHMPQKSSRNRIRMPMEIKLVKNKNISFSDSLQSPIPLRTSSPICQAGQSIISGTSDEIQPETEIMNHNEGKHECPTYLIQHVRGGGESEKGDERVAVTSEKDEGRARPSEPRIARGAYGLWSKGH